MDGQLTPEAQQRAFEQMVQQGVQAAMQPHLEAQEQSLRDAEADALEAKYPVLGDPAKAGEYIDKAVQQAQLLGRPELAREPGFLEMVYLADEATKKSAAEQSAGGQQEVTLPSVAGAPLPLMALVVATTTRSGSCLGRRIGCNHCRDEFPHLGRAGT